MNNLSRRVLVLTAAALWYAAAVVAQPLYLLKGAIRDGSSAEPWRSQVLVVDERSRRVTVAQDLNTEKYDGIAFCLINYEYRVIVLGLPAFRPTLFQVIDMDAPRQVRLLKPDFSQARNLNWAPYPQPPDRTIKPQLPKEIYASGEASLLAHPGLGLLLRLELRGPDGIADFGMAIRGRGGRPELTAIGLPDRLTFVSSGSFGLAFQVQASREDVSPFEANLKLRPKRGGEADLGVPSPPLAANVKAAARPMSLFVQTIDAMAIHGGFRSPDSAKGGDGSSTLYVRDKRRARWNAVTVPGDMPIFKSIGKYLLGTAHTQYYQRTRESPGKAEFEEMTKHVRWQDGIAASGAHHEGYYPGILFAVDVETGKMYQWSTGQADSEILWADEAAFYYRRANELLKVELVAGGSGLVVGPVSSILKAEVLLDVHAAFRAK